MKKVLIILFFPLSSFSQQTLYNSIIHDNIQRDYIIHIPNTYNVNNTIPLVFCFHGYGGNASSIMSYTNFNFISDTAEFIVVYPQGTLLQGTTHWNVGGWTLASSIDDVGFIAALIDSISYLYNINLDRIYSTGMSNGGYMSFLLACQLSHKIAAIASVTGSMTPQTYNQCNPEHPTPVLQIHGSGDQVVPYVGAIWSLSINDILQYWINFNSCDALPITTSITDINMFDGTTVERQSWFNGDNGVSTEHLKVFGGGHNWFGISGNMDIHSSAEIWNFFSKYDINGLIETTTEIIEDKKKKKIRLKYLIF